MCGIVGLAGFHAAGVDAAAQVSAATSALAHRGPDGLGLWSAKDAPVLFGHRRLAVLDLTSAASQPMTAGWAGGSAITYNGELYNFRALRTELERTGISFATTSDTEVLLAACCTWGVLETCRRSRGMFAFAYFDAPSRSLWLARDRFGEKPLYYSLTNGSLLFASELKALRHLPGFETTLDREALELFLRHSCIGGERSIFAGTKKLLPGTAACVPVADRISPGDLSLTTYWDPVAIAAEAHQDPFSGSFDDAVDELESRLERVMENITISDVPVGAFLSGGIDSATVVSQMCRRSSTVRTFTIGFGEDHPNEADEARRIASWLGTEHTELTVSAQDAMDVIPGLPEIYDEPFADSSQIPTILVARLARQHVTVALSGDGGDELFGGYRRHRLVPRIWSSVTRIPPPVTPLAARLIDMIGPAQWDRIGDLLTATPARHRSGGIAERMQKTSLMVDPATPDEIFGLLVTSFWERSPLLEPPDVDQVRLPPGPSVGEQVMLYDLAHYLPDDILTKVDRAAMSTSLETRIPLLDADLFELSVRLPVKFKIGRNRGKLVLRSLLARRVPPSLWNRPKQGFSVPLGSWLRGELRPWAEDLLAPASLNDHGLFDERVVQALWSEHQSGRRDWHSRLWNLLMFQAWYRRWMR
jgi:asparagine synthase (glutamine-hydrolysing)